jgi:hypothetical protein
MCVPSAQYFSLNERLGCTPRIHPTLTRFALTAIRNSGIYAVNRSIRTFRKRRRSGACRTGETNMATKSKTAKRGKKLATGKKISRVKPLLTYNLSEVYVSNVPMSAHSGEVPSK